MNLLNGAKDSGGTYTKKTKIYLNGDAIEDFSTHFHAGVSSLERTTHYDEVKGALLMGDYAGGFSINSGYMNDGEGNCQHFRYKGAADPSTTDLFTLDDLNAEYFVNHHFTRVSENKYASSGDTTVYSNFIDICAPRLINTGFYMIFSKVTIELNPYEGVAFRFRLYAN